MKYIDAEKLKAEIERRLNILTHVYAEQVERKDEEMMNYYHGKVIALEELRPFLDTLSKEPDKSLEEEIRRYLREECSGEDEPLVSEIARHFAKWQKEQMLKDAVEATVMATKCGDKYQQLLISDWNSMSDMCNGQKVRIVVLKAEEE